MTRVDSGYLPSPGMSPSGSASYDNVNRRIAERILDEKDKEEWKDSYELDEEKEGRKEGRKSRKSPEDKSVFLADFCSAFALLCFALPCPGSPWL